MIRTACLTLLLVTLAAIIPACADSSSPRLAAYYDRQMAIIGDKAFAWKGTSKPVQLPFKTVQVGVGSSRYFVLTANGKLVSFRSNPNQNTLLMDNVAKFAAGQSGVLAISNDDTLWWISASGKDKQHIADGVSAAAVGDGANYYITSSGALFVKGSAHRGQYGDGRLKPTDRFVQTASGAAQICAHTGHAILRMTNGDVKGTGGNIYGPVGKHGLGDKAIVWSKITSDARAIATGSSHSLTIRKDGTLMVWGSGYGPEPVQIMQDVVAVAAGSRTTIVLKRDNSLWQWSGAHKPQRVWLAVE